MRCCGSRAPIPRRRSKNFTPSFRDGPLDADLRCAIAHRGISRFRVRAFGAPRNDRHQNPIGHTSMSLSHLLNARRAAGKPVRVALIGAGKFGSMFLSQVPHTPGLDVPVIVDLDPERAREACRTVGWDAERIAATTFTTDAARATSGDIEVIVEATGNPAVGIKHARAAIAAGKHIVMVNVEADVLAGPILWPWATRRH